MTIAVNGQPASSSSNPGSYVAVDREWKSGDTITVKMPMALHLESLPDDPHIQALMYGPVVLAGDLGTAGLDSVKRYGPSAPAIGRVPSIPVPAFVTASADQVIRTFNRSRASHSRLRPKASGSQATSR